MLTKYQIEFLADTFFETGESHVQATLDKVIKNNDTNIQTLISQQNELLALTN